MAGASGASGGASATPVAGKAAANADGSRAGEDTEGHTYDNITEMWRKELAGTEGRRSWYAKAESHWEEQEASLNGILGGYPETNGPDLRESRRFLDLLRSAPGAPDFGMVLDCGAGIGRVTSGLLLDVFERVDLAEPNARLLATAQEQIMSDRVERFLPCSLQQLEPERERYDVIWAQWVLLYLPDDDLIRFLERCRLGLKRNGMICIKENVVLEGKWVIDREDNSIARTDEQYKAIFKRAGLQVVHELQQAAWPTDLIPVMMYALRPKSTGGGGRGPKTPKTPKKKPAAAMA